MGGGPLPCYPLAGWVFSLAFFYGGDHIITETDGAAGKAAGLCDKKKGKELSRSNAPSEGDLEKGKESEEARSNNEGLLPSEQGKRQETAPT